MQRHRTLSYAALLALVATTAVAQLTTPSVPSDSRCAGLTGSALDSCMQSNRDASPERTTPGRGDTNPAAPATPRNIVEPATPTPAAPTAPPNIVVPTPQISPSAPTTPRNIVEPAPPSSPSIPGTPRNIVEPIPDKGRIK